MAKTIASVTAALNAAHTEAMDAARGFYREKCTEAHQLRKLLADAQAESDAWKLTASVARRDCVKLKGQIAELRQQVA